MDLASGTHEPGRIVSASPYPAGLTPEMVALAGVSLRAKRPRYDWSAVARPAQLPPPGEWRTWLLMAGRGFGKTRTGAEFVFGEIDNGRARRVQLVAATASDVRDVVVEGISGILAVADRHGVRPNYEPSKRRITFPNGAICTTFSADEPDRLRGPEFDLAWWDELAAWKSGAAVENADMGVRLAGPKGDRARIVATTTPRPVPWVRELVKQEETGETAISRGSTFENAENLDPSALATIRRRYEGTRLGRQEIGGELLTDTPGALWTLAMIDAARLPADTIIPLTRIVIGIDPAVSVGEDSDETGIIVAGIDASGHGYVLDDLSGRYSPNEWATIAVSALDRWQADRIIAERNNGGQMVEHTIRTVRRNAPITTIHASRGKIARAEPVAALFEQGKVSHVGAFPILEDQMTTFVPDIVTQSPDHLDAMVYALSDLMVQVTTTFARSY
ncbi:MAG: terminase family protein [Chloroflexota bacterium]|nr:terminase family protein [Chloroflexota bacterium]